jgi:hypothetical protein
VKFVLVNGRTPSRQSACMLCCEKIGEGYLRDMRTRLCYCGAECYALFCGAEIEQLDSARRAREQRATKVKAMDRHHEVRTGQPQGTA